MSGSASPEEADPLFSFMAHRCETCGFLPCRCEDLASGDVMGAQRPGCWPMKSEAMAVHPEQIGEAHAASVAQGVPTQFDRLGRPIFTDPGHRRRYCEANGTYDRNGGYSDPQRR